MKIKNYADLFALDGFWRYKRSEKKKLYTDKTLESRASILSNWIIPLWGNYHPKRLTVQVIDKSMRGVVSDWTKKPLAGATRNKILAVLSELYKHLIEEGVVKFNPVRDVVRCNPAPENPRSALSVDDMKALFPMEYRELKRIWRTQKYICAFLILRDTGLRPGELIALKWKDWNPEIKFFPIVHAIESGSRNREKKTKTGMTKPAFVTDQTALEIERLHKKVKPKAEDYIFSNKYGIPYSTHRLSWNFRQSACRAGIYNARLTTYWLRHTFNTRSLEVMPSDLVRRLMGHTTEAMTRHYRHADAESLTREALRIKEQVSALRAG